MYVLERLVFQGLNVCPQYQWKQMALCSNKDLLESVKVQMRRPEIWRISPMACLAHAQAQQKGDE